VDAGSLERQVAALEALLREREAEIQALRPERVKELLRFQDEENKTTVEKDLWEDLWKCRKELASAQGKLQVFEKEVAHLKAACPKYQDKQMLCVKPLWTPRDIAVDGKLCFVLMPFSQSWSDGVHGALQRAVKGVAGELHALRADQQTGSVVVSDIWKGILSARVVIADLTEGNPNVCYELGLADALGKNLIVCCQTTDRTKIPFDFLGRRLIPYDVKGDGLERLEKAVTERLEGMVSKNQ